MTAVVAIILYVIALLVVLILAGEVRQGYEPHPLLLRSMHNATREPAETPWPKHYSAPWSKVLKDPGRTPAEPAFPTSN